MNERYSVGYGHVIASENDVCTDPVELHEQAKTAHKQKKERKGFLSSLLHVNNSEGEGEREGKERKKKSKSEIDT